MKSAEHPLVVRTTFRELEQELPPGQFMRIHKFYAVSVKEITAIRKNSVFLGDKELSVGETYRDQLAKLLAP